MSYWLVSVPTDGALGKKDAILSTLKSHMPSDVVTKPLKVPELKVGTLDSLMALSDDLERVDRYVEGVVHRLEKEIRNIINQESDPDKETPAEREKREKQLREMRFISRDGDNGDPAKGKGLAAEEYLKEFAWDQARYQIKSTLPELVKDMQDLVQRTDEDLKVKQMDYNQIKSAKATAERKKEGNLASRSLVDVVKREHYISSDRLDTVFCAVPTAGLPEFYEKYESFGKVPANDHPKEFLAKITPIIEKIEKLDSSAVDFQSKREDLLQKQLEKQVNGTVPGSAKEMTSDQEYTLVRVVIFKSARQSFEQDCLSKMTVRSVVRDCAFKEGHKEEEKEELKKLKEDELAARKKLKTWAQTHFSEAYRAWMHLKTIRVFTESVLRYGLPPKMAAILIKPGKHEDKVRKTLNTLYESLSSGMAGKNEDSATAAFYPYVDIEIRYTGDADI